MDWVIVIITRKKWCKWIGLRSFSKKLSYLKSTLINAKIILRYIKITRIKAKRISK